MQLSRKDLNVIISKWIKDWNNHDISAVMSLFHHDAQFISWAGQRFRSKRSICRAWTNWFANHGNFYFTLDLILVDVQQQIASIQWTLTWPSPEPERLKQKEVRRGVDVLLFKDGLIISKSSYCQTVLIIESQKVYLHL